MPPAGWSVAYIKAVLARGAIAELRYPRLCPSRQCRRRERCCDVADREPRCMALRNPEETGRLRTLIGMMVDILDDRYPPVPSKDPDTLYGEIAAVRTIAFHCLVELPWYHERVLTWLLRYQAPPAPPVPPEPPKPPVDTGKLLAEMRTEVARYRAIDEIRGI